MNLLTSFVIWTVAAGLFGWLIGPREQYPAVRANVLIGILGGVIGGCLWFPFFFETQPGIYSFVFDFLTFNLFAALCGAAPLLWVAHSVRDRRRRRRGECLP
jgi:uncharacterized membrane protein YeaQ/YmgE (transglycosylase-associated protein family)